jgi:NADH-quinone oxidoreductase subunit H
MEERGWLESLVNGLVQPLYDAVPWIVHLVPLLWILVLVAVSVLILIWAERKVSADIQSRVGPLHHGPIGVFQSVWDALKLLTKEDTIPRQADRLVFCIAPFIAFVPAVLVYVVIPFGKGWIAADLNVGLWYLLSVGSLGVVGVIVAGWASNNKWSLLGGMRAAAQLITYEIPMFLSVVVVIMMAGTLSMDDIVRNQAGGQWSLAPPETPFASWYCFTVPGLIASVLYLVAALAEVNRQPFDLPEAESELVSGFNTEYSGMRFAIFFLAEFSNTALVAGIAATIFFGGWSSPIVSEGEGIWQIFGDGIVWYFVKITALIYGMMWVKWTLPRVRIDQMLQVAWKGLIPLALINVAIAVAHVAWVGP